MKRDIVFIQACPNDPYWKWETHMWLESLKEIGKSHLAVSLIFVPPGREFNNKQWNHIIQLYPEAKFEFFNDEHNISKLIQTYIPIIRPYVLMRYFKKNPELKDKAIFYCDNDIYFNSKLDIDKYLDNDICYVSDTVSYLGSKYFDSKIKDVLPDKLEEYKTIDVLGEMCNLLGVTREIAEKNNLDSGGAQYLLKDIDWTFWDNVISNCLKVRQYLQSINRYYFESEEKGFQSWVADMVAVLYQLWYRNQETKVIPEMEFAWSSDTISKLEKPNIGIFHNAGIVSEFQGDIPVFYKGKYHSGLDPFKDPHLEIVHNNEKSKTLCNWYYVDRLINLKNKYNL